METKICILCNEEKEITQFRPHRKYCKKCGNIMLKEWKEKNKEHIKKYNKKYFQEHKEQILIDRKEYMYNYRQTKYIADFTYIDENGKYHVVDTKGFKTKEYLLKKKLMAWKYGIEIEEV